MTRCVAGSIGSYRGDPNRHFFSTRIEDNTFSLFDPTKKGGCKQCARGVCCGVFLAVYFLGDNAFELIFFDREPNIIADWAYSNSDNILQRYYATTTPTFTNCVNFHIDKFFSVFVKYTETSKGTASRNVY